MNKKLLRRLKIIIYLFIIILIIELCYIGYSILYKREESLYFDGINAIEVSDSYYVTVGSNNDNDNYYEKAKVSLYNSKREKTFEKLYNVGYNSAFFGVCIYNDSIIAVGSYEKTDQEHEDSVRRALIVKYNHDGDVLFESDFKLLDNSRFMSIVSVEDGYLVTGQSVYMSTKVGSSEGGAILAKYDKDLNLVWYKTYGSSKSAIYNDLLVKDSYIYTVGTDENHLGILCKYDLDGNFIVYNDYKYTDDIGFSSIVSIDNDIYVCGSNRGEDNTTNAMIVQYSLDCEYIKEVIYSNEGMVRYNKLVCDDNNNLIAIGIITTNNKSSNKTADSFNYDGLVGKYDSSLKEMRVVTYGDDRDDYFTDIKVVEGNYLIVGYSSYEDGSYLSKFIRYSDALKMLGVD